MTGVNCGVNIVSLMWPVDRRSTTEAKTRRLACIFSRSHQVWLRQCMYIVVYIHLLGSG